MYFKTSYNLNWWLLKRNHAKCFIIFFSVWYCTRQKAILCLIWGPFGPCHCDAILGKCMLSSSEGGAMMGSGQRAQTLPVNKAVECYFSVWILKLITQSSNWRQLRVKHWRRKQSSKKAQSEISDSWLTVSPSPLFGSKSLLDYEADNGLLQWSYT